MTRPVATSSAANSEVVPSLPPLVVVRAPLDLARAHRQQRLGAVERLDLAFLVDAQDQRPIRRGHVQPDHVAHLRDEVGVGRELEGLDPVRLQAERPPDPLHRGGGQATRLGHAARAPMRAVGRQALESPADHRLDPLVADLAWRARARLVAQPVQPMLGKSVAPLADRVGVHSEPRADQPRAAHLGAGQHDPGPQRQPLCRPPPHRQGFQCGPLRLAQLQCLQPRAAHHALPIPLARSVRRTSESGH